MHFGVLGSLEVWRGDDLVAIASANERKILTALLVHANDVVSTSRLIEVIWGENPPESDRNALQTYVARLRRRLATADTPAPIVTRPPGYAIELDTAQLDSLCFRALFDDARARLATDPARALELLDSALAMWRGPAFAEFAHEDVARAEAASLEELRQAAIEDRADALLAVGRISEAVSLLEGVVAAHPLRERPHAGLMRALARDGRQVESLRLFQTFRKRLADELGLEPSGSLRALETEVLAQAPAIAPATPATGNLAPAITTFVGRDADIEALRALCADRRLITLVGVGGVGKTRLALRVGESLQGDYTDGPWVVELARVTAGDAVPHAVAAALRLTLPNDGDPFDSVVEALRPRRMLLIVDNCEHVLADAGRLVDAIARRCPDVTILNTSRERLGVDGEHVWPVVPLPTPPPTARPEDAAASPAVALFLDRARAARADFVLDESNAAAVTEICRGLDGLPLALEIAAARVGVLTTPDLLQRLRDRFALLTAGPRGEGERHRTLRSLVDWSYGLLDDTERATFDRLSVFAGGWTLEAAAAVCPPATPTSEDVTVTVANLADKSMIVPPAPSGRYGMLETLRLYGAEHLAARGEQGEAGSAHARYFLRLAEAAEPGLRGPHEREWVERLRAELDNFRAAHEWARGEDGELDVALQLSVALHRFATWQANDEILSWAEALVDLSRAQEHPLFPVVLGCASVRRMHRGEWDIATAYAERALSICDDRDDLRRALPIESLAGVCLLSGRLDESLVHCDEFGRLWRLAGYDIGEIWALCNRAVILAKEGDVAAAKVHSDRARAIATPTANPTMLAVVSYCEGECLLEGDPVQALDRLAQALMFARAADNVFMTGNALVSNTSVRGRHGDPSVALPLFAEVIDYWRRTGGWTQLWLTLRNLAELVGRLGAYEDAAVLLGACEAFNRTSRPYGAEADRLAALGESLVSNLGERGFEDAKARGEALDDGDAVAFAAAVTRRLQPT